MITIRDYAAKKGCTVQNIYKLLKKYDSELSGHYSKIGSKTFLDDFAQTFLDSYITPKTLMAPEGELLDEINRLRGLLSQADHKAAEFAQQNSEMAIKLQKMDSERLLLEADVNHLKKENESLAEAKNNAEKSVEEKQKVIDQLNPENESLKKEIEKRDQAGLIARIFKKWD